MHLFKKFSTVLVALAIALTLGFTPVHAEGENNVTIDVLSINDFHGALLESGKDVGAAKLVKALKDLQAKNPNSVVVSAGDNFNGSALSNLLYGEPVTKAFKEAGVRLSAVGNHEFDWGLDKFPIWTEQFGFPFLAANIIDKTTGKPVTWAQPFNLVNVDGIVIGFIGLTTPETAVKTTPANVANLTFADPTEVAKEWIPKVKAAGADVVILLTHIGTFQDKEGKITFESDAKDLATSKPDAIITAHSHQTVVGKVDETPVVQAYYNGRTIADLTIVVDKSTKKVVSITPSLKEIYKDVKTLKADEATKTMLDSYKPQVDPILNEHLGKNSTELLRDRNALSAVGEWTAEVMRKATKADIGVTNAGGLRSDIPAGDVTMGTMYSFMPFDNVLDTFEFTGAQIKELFEFGTDNIEATNGFVQFSGVTVYTNPQGEKGNKVLKLVLDDGRTVNADEKYVVVTNDFMGTGGDNYSVFKKAKELKQTLYIRDALADAVKEAGTLTLKQPNRVITLSTLPETISTITSSKVFEGMKIKAKQVGAIYVNKATNLMKAEGKMLVITKQLQPDTKYRVYNVVEGGRYDVGGGFFIQPQTDDVLYFPVPVAIN